MKNIFEDETVKEFLSATRRSPGKPKDIIKTSHVIAILTDCGLCICYVIRKLNH